MKWFAVVLLINSIWASDHNPEENENAHNPDLFEGDIRLTPEQEDKLLHQGNVDDDQTNRKKRGSGANAALWQNGILVYEIDRSLSDPQASAAIRAAMNEWESKTCIRFRRRTNEVDYVRFRWNDGGCYSYIGKVGNAQPINLSRGCWTSGIVAHEIAHALGFYHEQSRPDRDQFIQVNLGNVIAGTENNFLKYTTEINSLGTAYDYGSIMHYGSKAFSKNGQPTIVPRQQGVTIGQRRFLSPTDAQQANLLYKNCAVAVRCVENNIYCPFWRRFCYNSRYQAFAQNNCPKTCGVCS